MGFIKKFASEFKEFALKGNVVDMAIGVIIGAAFKDIVTSFTDNFINSVGGANIAGSIRLPWVNYEGMALEDVQKLSLNYGSFISAIINFLIMALILFSMLKAINALKNIGKKKAEEAPAAPPEPSDEVKLLTEIKDILKEKK